MCWCALVRNRKDLVINTYHRVPLVPPQWLPGTLWCVMVLVVPKGTIGTTTSTCWYVMLRNGTTCTNRYQKYVRGRRTIVNCMQHWLKYTNLHVYWKFLITRAFSDRQNIIMRVLLRSLTNLSCLSKHERLSKHIIQHFLSLACQNLLVKFTKFLLSA